MATAATGVITLEVVNVEPLPPVTTYEALIALEDNLYGDHDAEKDEGEAGVYRRLRRTATAARRRSMASRNYELHDRAQVDGERAEADLEERGLEHGSLGQPVRVELRRTRPTVEALPDEPEPDGCTVLACLERRQELGDVRHVEELGLVLQASRRLGDPAERAERPVTNCSVEAVLEDQPDVREVATETPCE